MPYPMKIKFASALIIILLSSFITVNAQEIKGNLTWFTDIKKADEASKKSGKPIFALFTGSDWCVWCHKLENDVFSKKDFIDWAKNNVVLLELDFPRKKQLPPDLAKQNMELQQVLQVQGFPTVFLLYLEKQKGTDKININTLGSLGYPQNAPAGKEEIPFLNEANELLKKGRKNP
jgi:thioredoxin-related protein